MHGCVFNGTQTAIAFEMNNEFGPHLEVRLKHFNNASATGGAISAVQGKLDTVKGVMVQNIEMILERGEKLELLVDKTDQLQTQVQRQLQFFGSDKMIFVANHSGSVHVRATITTNRHFSSRKLRRN